MFPWQPRGLGLPSRERLQEKAAVSAYCKQSTKLVLRLHSTCVNCGGQTPPSQLRTIAPTCDWRLCHLIKHGSWQRGKDKCGWYGPHWMINWTPPQHEGFWKEALKQETARILPLSLALPHQVGHWELRPHPVQSQLWEAESHAEMHDSPSSSPSDSVQHTAWVWGCFHSFSLTAAHSGWDQDREVWAWEYSLAPGVQATWGARDPWKELPLQDHLKRSGSTPQTPGERAVWGHSDAQTHKCAPEREQAWGWRHPVRGVACWGSQRT